MVGAAAPTHILSTASPGLFPHGGARREYDGLRAVALAPWHTWVFLRPGQAQSWQEIMVQQGKARGDLAWLKCRASVEAMKGVATLAASLLRQLRNRGDPAAPHGGAWELWRPARRH